VATQIVISPKSHIAKVAAQCLAPLVLFRRFLGNNKWSFFLIFRWDFGHIDLEPADDA
jgi:hypothetical protein